MKTSGPLDRSRELIAEAYAAFRRGDNESTRRAASEALELARRAQDDRSLSVALTWLARAALRDGASVMLRRLADDALAAAQRTDDVATTIGPLHLIAASDRMAGDLDSARRGYARTRELSRQAGDARMALLETINLAAVDLLARDVDTAGRHAKEALREVADQPRIAAVCLSILGGVAVGNGDAERGARLLGAAEGMIGRTATIFDPDDRAEHDARLASAKAALGSSRYEAFANDGRSLTDEAAVALALALLSAVAVGPV